MEVVERFRDRADEVASRQCVFRKAPVDRVPGEGGRIAEVLKTTTAVWTLAIGAAQPRDPNPRAERQVPGSASDNFADNLVARHQTVPNWWQLAFDHMQVGSADAAGVDFQKNVSGLQSRLAISAISRG